MSVSEAGLCKDCKWWQSMCKETGQCLKTYRISNGWAFPETKARALAQNTALEDIEEAILETDADFGCNQFSRRSEASEDS